MAFVFFAAELYATAVLVYVRAPPAAPTMGLFTAFLTIISARAVYVPPSSSSSSFCLPQVRALPDCLAA